MNKILKTFLIAVTVLIAIRVHLFFKVPETPVLGERYWGPGEGRHEDTPIQEFRIDVPKEVLTDLRNRLENARTFTEPLEGVQQQYGFNTRTLSNIVSYWLHEYNWTEREKYLNQFPQYQTKIQGLNIHYLHVKPKTTTKAVLPLLLLHGWPGSVREFYKIIPMLTKVHEEHGFAFEIIAPSLPGFAFSDAASKPGLGAMQMAVVMKNLMRRLGFDKFYVQGGDWGGYIVQYLAIFFPDNILGLHSNFAFTSNKRVLFKILLGSMFPSLVIEKKYEHKLYPLSTDLQWKVEESGYFHIQATKPDTIGVAMNDSPAGLAAYILEKFSTATNFLYKSREDAGLLEKFTYDELLDNLMIYWVTKSATSSFRIYAESFTTELSLGVSKYVGNLELASKKFNLATFSIPIDPKVPCAVARFPHEIFYLTDWMLRDKFTNLVQTTDFDEGGHFAALEVPELLAEDVFSAVSKMSKM